MNAFAPVSSFRAGASNCVCPPGLEFEDGRRLDRRELALIGFGSAASIFSQVLMFSLLPLVGRMLAPAGYLASLPFIALFVGAVVATFPAAVLTDQFGRRAAFALGASLGIAGGFVAAWGLVYGAFWPLVMGAFWIGTANGFALQYRHVAARGPSGHNQLAIVVGAGAIIGVVAPTLTGLAEVNLAPFLGAGTALLAAASHVVALGTALALPAEPVGIVDRLPSEPARGGWLAPTAVAAAAWFGMMGVMAFAPLGLAGCGFDLNATVGAVVWHLVAMYAPAIVLGRALDRAGAWPVALAGLVLIAVAMAASMLQVTAAGIMVGLIAAGAGWSIATTAAVAALHRSAPGRLAVAGHDAVILVAGIAGAFAVQFLNMA
jgi:hypothetical protein